MKTATRRIAIALSAALVATTALAPMASAREWQDQHRDWHGEQHRGHDNTAALLGFGIAALAGAAIIANIAQPAPPAYVPAPAYAPQPYYAAQPTYAAPAPTCTTINGAAACIGPDGNWQYVR
jgi:hypothetical protein